MNRPGLGSQLSRIWAYRELLGELFRTWLLLKHAGSLLGLLWTLLNPLLLVGTYWFVFSTIFRVEVERYPLLIIPGFLAWNFTFGAVQAAGESIISSKYLITRIAFPGEILVLASVGVTLVEFLIGLGILSAVLVVLAPQSAGVLLLLPLLLAAHILFTTGVSLLAACGSVFFRDIPRLIPIAGTIMFFLTPIFYTLDMVPGGVKQVVWLNPLTWFFSVYHDLLYRQTMPDPLVAAGTLGLALAACWGGLAVFRMHRHSFAELS
ncbi:MAG: ABC transporter permease [Bacteroidota bacterium]